MFDAGLAELVLIFVLGLLILGPERLPRVAAQLGRWVSRARRTATQLRYQLEREIAMNDLKRQPFKPPQRAVPPQNSQTTPAAAAETGGPAGGRSAGDAAGADAGADAVSPTTDAADSSSSAPAGDSPSPGKPPPAA